MQAWNIKERVAVLHKGIFEIFEILEHPFLFQILPKKYL